MNRPLSPHLQIHKPLLTMVFSITHRISAIVFFASLIPIGLWISSIYLNEGIFNFINIVLNSSAVKILILLWLAFVNHFVLNEIKHLIWSQVKVMELNQVYPFSYMILSLNFFIVCLVGIKII
ncbi:succinate dehydrogenase, cytochrome b556 subunit [Alphaproteobacteria bacterium]|nr:succinate dehydrogenase, cytochrome b556 subunit [Alphaproteobacteria bacterium]